MPPQKISMSHDRQQRQFSEDRTPSSFWDNLSKQWLTRGALREFDRRTVTLAIPVPPDRTGKEDINHAQLKRFARYGGPSLEDLRAYLEPRTAPPLNRTTVSRQSSSGKRANSGREPDIPSKRKRMSVQYLRQQVLTENKAMSERESNTPSKIQKTSAYDMPFEQHLIDHGVCPDEYDDGRYPANWEEIKHRLAQPRLSLSSSSFSREEFRIFQQKNRLALNKGMVMSTVFPTLAGSAPIPSAQGLPFGNLKALTDGTITKAQPDFYDGARLAELSIHIREELGGYIVPASNTAAPCLANFFAEIKGSSGALDTCYRKALYDGALGARGVHQLRSYIGPKTLLDNNAYTITSTYSAGLLSIYCVHPALSDDSQRIDYRMTHVNGWALTANPDQFRQGIAALRNARDWAKERREELIAAANSKAQDPNRAGSGLATEGSRSPSSNEPTLPDPATSSNKPTLPNSCNIN